MFDITTQRIQQILASRGLSAKDGGQHLLAKRTEAKREAEMNQRIFDLLGMSRQEVKDLRGRYQTYQDSPFNRYRIQRSSALARSIEWRFNFSEWWKVWDQSGKYDKRGRETGQFVMARFNDIGPYSKDNVKIVTCSENCSEVRLREVSKYGVTAANLKAAQESRSY